MARTKSDILTRVAAFANGEATVPTGDEYSQWSEFLEMANQEWCYAYEPQVLVKTFPTTILQSGTSVALPADFKEKFAGYVDVGGTLFEELDPIEATRATGDYVTWGGNQTDGYYVKTSKAMYSTLAMSVPYHSRATTLATLTSVSPIPDPEFLTMRTTEMVLLQRGQAEYIEFQQKADLLLERLVATEQSSDIQKNKTIRTMAENANFIIGVD